MDWLGYAQRIQSPNGVYILAWSDAETVLTRRGEYRQRKGSYALFENEDLILSGKLQRPNDGKVADNGNFIFNDWMFQIHEKGTFYAIDRNGETLIRKRFRANLFRNELSLDGRFAVCQTANSDNDDGARLTFFDLKARDILWHCHPPDWGTDSYEFDADKEILYLKYRDGSIFRYSFGGEFLDAERWEDERLKRINGFELHFMARQKINSLEDIFDSRIVNEIFLLLETALQRGLDPYLNEQAAIHRTMGEMFEKLRQMNKAIEHYEKALDLNPRIGLKRKLQAIKQKYAGQDTRS